jgi:hypothetical protein
MQSPFHTVRLASAQARRRKHVQSVAALSRVLPYLYQTEGLFYSRTTGGETLNYFRPRAGKEDRPNPSNLINYPATRTWRSPNLRYPLPPTSHLTPFPLPVLFSEKFSRGCHCHCHVRPPAAAQRVPGPCLIIIPQAVPGTQATMSSLIRPCHSCLAGHACLSHLRRTGEEIDEASGLLRGCLILGSAL